MPSRIGQVRSIVSAQLRHWHLEPLVDLAVLGVTELLTNVHRHAGPDKMCTVEIELARERLTVSVHDRDPRLPAVRDADPLATCGRGLAMVAALSESWGVRPQDGRGKVVWFALPAPVHTPPVAPYPVYRTAASRSADAPLQTPARSAVAG
nr:ATP-binding protein [Streptomyces sp. SID5785]